MCNAAHVSNPKSMCVIHDCTLAWFRPEPREGKWFLHTVLEALEKKTSRETLYTLNLTKYIMRSEGRILIQSFYSLVLTAVSN